MHERYLEVTFRKGQPFAAYLYLPRAPGATSVRTEEASDGLLVDYAQNGEPIGIEITAPRLATLESINNVLATIGVTGMTAQELRPLAA